MGTQAGEYPSRCPCYDVNTYQKIVDLKDAGLVIYHQTSRVVNDAAAPDEVLPISSTEDIFILHNTKDVDIMSADIMPAFDKQKISCPRCRHIIENAQKLLRGIPKINKNDILGICDHCRTKLFRGPCEECDEVVKKFMTGKDEVNIAKKYIKIWLSKIQNLGITDVDIGEKKMLKPKKVPSSNINIDDLHHNSPMSIRELEVTDLCYSDNFKSSSARNLQGMSEHPCFPKYKKKTTFSDYLEQDRAYFGQMTGKQFYSKSFQDFSNIAYSTVPLLEAQIDTFGKAESTTDHTLKKIQMPQFVPGKYHSEESISPLQKRHSEESKAKYQYQSNESLMQRRRRKLEDKYTSEQRLRPYDRLSREYTSEEKLTSHERRSQQMIQTPQRKSKSLERVTSISGIIEDNLKHDFRYFFPQQAIEKEMKIRKKRISSSELIKDTQDKLQAQAEEKRLRLEEERRRKQEELERKRIAREKERLRRQEEKRLAEEARRAAEEARRAAEEEARRLAEEERKRLLEEEKQRHLEEEKQRRAEEAKKRAEDAQRKKEKKKEKTPKTESAQKSKEPSAEKKKTAKVREPQSEKPPKEPRREKPPKEPRPEKSPKEPHPQKSKKELPPVKPPKEAPSDKSTTEDKPKHEALPVSKEKTGEELPKESGQLKQKGQGDEFGKSDEKQGKQADEEQRLKKLKEEEERKAKEEAERKVKEMDRQAKSESKAKKAEDEKPKPEKKLEMPSTRELNIKQIKLQKPSTDDLLMKLVQMKKERPQEKPKEKQIEIPRIPSIPKVRYKNKKSQVSIKSTNSDLELDLESLANKHEDVKLEDIIIGPKIYKYKPPIPIIDSPKEEVLPLAFKTCFNENILLNVPGEADHVPKEAVNEEIERKPPLLAKGKGKQPAAVDMPSGIVRYALSDRSFIDMGWTVLPTEKVVRKMNVYRMRPAHPEFDWFEHHKNKRLMTYDGGEKLAEFDDNGRGRWYYKNGRLALDYYDAEEINAQQRFVIYSNGEPDERGRSRPITILATFDYLGNGIVFDHSGKIRLKYNQTEGVVLDRAIGPVSHWKWHTLNDPPVLQQVMIDTQMPHKDPEIIKMGGAGDNKARPYNEEMLAIEFDNFIKEKTKKLTQKFKPFQIKMKALKINECFSLRVLDQATIYLIFRDGSANLKMNIGMVLDHKEIVDTDTAEVGEVSNSLQRLPARTDSIAGLQSSVAHAQRVERKRVERERRLRPPEPSGSADRLKAAVARPLRKPFRPASEAPSYTQDGTAGYPCKCRKPTYSNLYYDTRLF